MNVARYVMVGGFLGAGKSTAVSRLALQLTDDGKRVGLITNDQGSNLVDTSVLRAQGYSVEEIAGGCFCCRFGSLKAAADELSAVSRPDVFIAEPVGSCTDLVATVSYPLRRIYGNAFRIAPLSVLVDPLRALRILGLEEGRKFSRNVAYIYEKQLEEAEIIVINKIDLLSPERTRLLRGCLERKYPRAEVFEVSAREGVGLEAWFERLTDDEPTRGRALEIDYDTYADGEARLGWLNCTLELDATREIDGNALLLELANRLGRRLSASNGELAHLKMTLSPDAERSGSESETGPGPDVAGTVRGPGAEISAVNLVRVDQPPDISHRLSEPLSCGQIIVNVRAEADPESLRDALLEEIEVYQREEAVSLEVEHLECFRPGRPVPTHRMSEPGTIAE